MGVNQNVLEWPGPAIRTALRDGTPVRVRPARAADEAAARTFLDGVSADALHSRFFGMPQLDRVARSLVAGEPGDWALVAEADGEPGVVAHAACLQLAPGTAEVAFLVADAWQGRGLGTVMLGRLVELARRRSITSLRAEVLPSNWQMLSLFHRSGLVSRVTRRGDVATVHMTAARHSLALAA